MNITRPSSRGNRLACILVCAAAVFLLIVVLSSQAGAVPDLQLPTGTPCFLPVVFKAPAPTPTPGSGTPMPVAIVPVGIDPYGSASDETDEVFVANHGAGTVSVLQGTAAVDTIEGFDKPYGVAYNPLNDRIYVTDQGSGEVVIVNPVTRTIVRRLGGSDSPRGIAIDRSTGVAFVASPGSGGTGAVQVYTMTDVTNGTPGTTVSSVGVGPSWVAVDSSTHKAYVTLQGEANYGLAMIDGAAGGYPVTFVGLNTPGAFGVAYDAVLGQLYVASGTGATLSVLDVSLIGTESNPVVAALETSPQNSLDTVAVNPATGHVFVTGRLDLAARLWILDGNALDWLDASFSVGSYADGTFLRGTSFDPVRAWFYISNEYADQVYVFSDEGGGPTPTPTPTTVTPTPTPVPGTPSLVDIVSVGADPYGSASDETDEVFVANHAAGTVSVLQGTTVVDTISGFNEPYGVAYNPVNGLIYVTDEGNGEVVIVDPGTHGIVKRLGGSANPRGVAVDRSTGEAYVASPGTGGTGAVRVYAPTDVTNGTEGTLVNSVGVGPAWVAVDSGTHKAYVTLQGEANYGLAMIDGAAGGYPVTFVGVNTPGAFGVAFDAVLDQLYVASGTGATLSVLDVNLIGTETNPVVAALKTDPENSLDTVAVNPATGHVFVTGRRSLSAKVWILDGAVNDWLDVTFDVGSYAEDTFLRGTSFDPVHSWFYVSSEYADRVYIFNDGGEGPTPTPTPTTLTPAACYPAPIGTPVVVGADPYGSASDETDEVFVANHAAGTVSVLQGTTVVDTISGFNEPYGVAYNPVNGLIYVTDEGNGEVVIVDPGTHGIVKRLGGSANPRGVAVDRSTGGAYVASPGTGGTGAVRVYAPADVTNGTEGTLVNSVGVGPAWVAVDSGTHKAYVTLQGEANYGLAMIDGAAGGYPVTFVGVNTPGAFGVAFDAVLDQLYVASGTGATLSVLDVNLIGTETNPVVAALKTDPENSLDTVAVNPSSGRVFVTGRADMTSKLWVLDGTSNTWLTTNFTVGSYDLDSGMMRGISYNAQNGYVYVSSEYADRVYVFDDNGSPVCP